MIQFYGQNYRTNWTFARIQHEHGVNINSETDHIFDSSRHITDRSGQWSSFL